MRTVVYNQMAIGLKMDDLSVILEESTDNPKE